MMFKEPQAANMLKHRDKYPIINLLKVMPGIIWTIFLISIDVISMSRTIVSDLSEATHETGSNTNKVAYEICNCHLNPSHWDSWILLVSPLGSLKFLNFYVIYYASLILPFYHIAFFIICERKTYEQHNLG